MTEQVIDDIWVGVCPACGERYHIPDDRLVGVYPQLMLMLDQIDEFTAICMRCNTVLTLARQVTKVVPFSAWTVLPAARGCHACGTDHPQELPHNWQTLLYQYWFRQEEAKAGRPERWPTIKDAMAHCTPAIQQAWTEALREKGVEV